MLWPSFEGRMATAAVIGPFAVTRYLLITPALIELLSPAEIEAVMAHEIGHVKHHHLQVYFIFFLSLFLLNYAFFELIVSWLLTTDLLHYLLLRAPHHQATIVSLASTIPLLLIYILYFRFLFGYFLRNFERQADLYVFRALGTAEPLISAFRKLAWLTGDHGQRANWHHYNIPQRIAFLEKCQRQPEMIAAHHRRLRRGLGLFLIAVALLGAAGHRLNASGLQRTLDNRFLIKVLENYRRRHQEDARVYLTLGSLYYEVGDYRRAISLYEAALQAGGPPQPELLNNYAWLLLTADDPQYRDIEKGFLLARQAAKLKPVPHILDTLAEAYWRRGMPCMALDIEKRILAGKPKNQQIYARQAAKFARDCRQ
jgi:tetratricopeptide (TPR) repeat protein